MEEVSSSRDIMPTRFCNEYMKTVMNPYCDDVTLQLTRSERRRHDFMKICYIGHHIYSSSQLWLQTPRLLHMEQDRGKGQRDMTQDKNNSMEHNHGSNKSS